VSKRFVPAFSTDLGADWMFGCPQEPDIRRVMSPFWKCMAPNFLTKLKRQLWEECELAEGLNREVLIRVR
jgi:hypothetical protein